ncbi:MAG TPA: extracellular solute-binding protein, partial [Clostridia bacterium]|nr:extracellular solute-binding protein [Clostridia bacterium]
MTSKRLVAFLTVALLLVAAIPAAGAAGFNAEGLPILTEPETFDVVVAYSSYCLIDWNDKTFYKDRAAETNISYNFTVLNDWTTQTNLMLASGDLPHIFMGSVAIDDNIDYFQDLTALIDQYAPSLLEAVEQQPSLVAGMKSVDGTIRSLSTHFAAVDNYMGTMYWVNQNWLDAVNMEMPTTIDELYDVLVAFRDNDPNANGQKDEIPLAFNEVQWAGKIANMFGLHGILYNTSNFVQVDANNQVIFQPAQEEFYNALVWLNKLQAEGLLDREGFSQTNDQYTA